jgi:hypothetical protein
MFLFHPGYFRHQVELLQNAWKWKNALHLASDYHARPASSALFEAGTLHAGQ